MKNSQQHLGNETNVTLRKNINLVPRLLSHFRTMFYNLQSAVCSLRFAVCGLRSAVRSLQSFIPLSLRAKYEF